MSSKRKPVYSQDNHEDLFIGTSSLLKKVLGHAGRLAGSNANVLIQGESGTGKELLARYLHHLEAELDRPFVALNCAAIPDNLIESEFFGHEAGAFTGADKRKIGRVEMADGGDLFLDEINSLKPELQAKLLRMIQEQEFYRVGATEPTQVQFRVIAAANSKLDELVQEGKFRQDLYYRLRVVSLELPALRERIEDIPILSEHFLKKYSPPAKRIASDAMAVLKRYSWPGNVRELQNLMRSVSLLSRSDIITVDDLPRWVRDVKQATTVSSAESHRGWCVWPKENRLKDVLDQIESEYIQHVIDDQNGNVSAAAKVLGISRSNLYYRLKRSAIMH